MKVTRLIVGLAFATTVMVAGTAQSVSATQNSVCDIPKLQLGEATGKNMVVANGKITATFTVTGSNCITPVTLAVWKSPSANGQPINDQKLFTHTTATYGPGVHTISANLPDCYFQADLLVGSNPTAPDGTPNYAYQNGQILTVHPLRDWKFGGDKKCEDPKTPEVPQTPQTPAQPQTLSTQTTQLPATGPTAVATTFVGVSTLGGLIHAISRRFRK